MVDLEDRRQRTTGGRARPPSAARRTSSPSCSARSSSSASPSRAERSWSRSARRGRDDAGQGAGRTPWPTTRIPPGPRTWWRPSRPGWPDRLPPGRNPGCRTLPCRLLLPRPPRRRAGGLTGSPRRPAPGRSARTQASSQTGPSRAARPCPSGVVRDERGTSSAAASSWSARAWRRRRPGVFGHGDVGYHAGALPVRPGDRVDRARERDADVHGRANGERAGRVSAAARGLTDDLRAPQRLQGVGEVLAAGEGATAGQHVDRLVDVTGARHVGQRPELPGFRYRRWKMCRSGGSGCSSSR